MSSACFAFSMGLCNADSPVDTTSAGATRCLGLTESGCLAATFTFPRP